MLVNHFSLLWNIYKIKKYYYKVTSKRNKPRKKEIDFPLFCDYTCKFSSFTAPTATGACRKELAVWCKHFKRYNNKNNKCLGTVLSS